MIWHWYKFWKQEMVFRKLFFLGLFFFFNLFPSDKTLPSFFSCEVAFVVTGLGGVWQADFSGMWLQTAVSFWKWTSAFQGGFEMDADMCELIQFVTYIGVWQRMGFFLLFMLSPCNKNTGRVFLVLQLQWSCHPLSDPLWRSLTFCCRAFHPGSKEKGERIHSPWNIRVLSHAIDDFQMVTRQDLCLTTCLCQ